MTSLSVAVVCRRPDDAKEVVNAIIPQLLPEDELLIVSQREEELGQVRFLTVAEPRGGCSNVGEARDIALRSAKHDLLLFIDSDCRPDQDFLSRVRSAALLLRGEVICIGGPVFPHKRTFISQYFERSLFSPFPRERKLVVIRRDGDLLFHHHPNTSNLLVDKRKALEVGGFRGGRGEDLDFVLRSLKRYSVVLSPLLSIEHEHPRSIVECLRSFVRLGGGNLRTLVEHGFSAVVIKRALILCLLAAASILGVLALGIIGLFLPYVMEILVYVWRRCCLASLIYPLLDLLSLLSLALGGIAFLARCYQQEVSRVVSPVS